jgi:hypothetical protein
MKTTLFLLVVAAVLTAAPGARAQSKDKKADLFPKDERTYAQKEHDRNAADVKKASEAQQKSKTAEVMRDKTHDGRVKVGKDISVGGQTGPTGLNVRTTTK